MKLKKISLTLFFFICVIHLGKSQQLIQQDSINIYGKTILNSLNISTNITTNELDNHFILNLFSDVNILSKFYNSEFHPFDSAIIPLPLKKENNFAEAAYNNNNLFFLFNDNYAKAFHSVNYNTIDHSISEYSFPFYLKKERIIHVFRNKDSINLLTILNNSSKLNLYTFSSYNHYTKHEIDLSQVRFDAKSDLTLSSFLNPNRNTDINCVNIQEITPEIPYPLELTINSNKLYLFQDSLKITIENSEYSTVCISINLTDYTYKVDMFLQGYVNTKEYGITNANSFIHDNYIFQVKTSSVELSLLIRSLHTGEIVKEYKILEDSLLELKNSPITQSGGFSIFAANSERTLETNSQFLRKITSGNVGLSIYNINDTLQLILGSYKKVTNEIDLLFKSLLLYHVITPYSIWGMYYYYLKSQHSKEIKITSLLSPINFKHFDGIPSDNIFETVASINNSIDNPLSGNTIFRFQESYYYSFFNKKDHKYYFYKL